ncbi:MAG: HAMP domain-containing histidine kinase [Bacteroidales bacterium]|jgi:two-component system phosphate regulon sensor histidine kinase PhoR|nr:HAMP domain-containing histidine kinase [Bacteroidales bacterium]
MRGQQVRFVVLLGAISIIGILSAQSYFLFKAWNIKEKQLIQTLFIALKTVAEKISRLNQTTLPYGNPVRQITSNYFVVDVNCVIDANVLEYYLKSEFEKLNIRTDYEYAIYDCHTDRMVYGDYVSITGSGEKTRLGNNLPKYHEYLYYFGIRFPGLRSTLAWDMTLLFFFSAILVISVVFFVYAIFVILQQKRLSELQRDFINNMTHEFKTPISTINISADVITQPEILQDPKRLFKYGAFIRQENQRLNLLVEKVLQIARIEKGGVQLKMERIDLNSLIGTIADNFQTNLRPGAKMEISLNPEVGQISADILHLTNIFHNLTDNALKYAGEDPQIRIETRRIRDHVQILFSDNGPGIEPRYHKRIFQKFFRIPSGNIHDVKGFGLGLYYVKIICRAHKWNIRIDSKSDTGSTFIIEIPAK